MADNSVGPSSMLDPGLHFSMSNTDIHTITFYDQSEKFSHLQNPFLQPAYV